MDEWDLDGALSASDAIEWARHTFRDRELELFAVIPRTYGETRPSGPAAFRYVRVYGQDLDQGGESEVVYLHDD
jgi:hypothetical protein